MAIGSELAHMFRTMWFLCMAHAVIVGTLHGSVVAQIVHWFGWRFHRYDGMGSRTVMPVVGQSLAVATLFGRAWVCSMYDNR